MATGTWHPSERWRDPRGPVIRPPNRLRTRSVLAVVAAMVGFIIGVQARQSGRPETRLAAESPEDLTRILADLNAEADRLAREVSALRVRVTRYRSSAERDELLLQDADASLRDLQVMAGGVAVVGPGLVVSIRDPEREVGWEEVLDLVQELRDAGAEAIAVNGRRVVGSTWFGPARTGLAVDGRATGAPYRLEAVGAPRSLREALDIAGGPLTLMGAQPGVAVDLVESEGLTLPALQRRIAFRYARPAP